MGVEIERKFLVDAALLPPLPSPAQLSQGYLASDPAVRVRLTTLPTGERFGALTVKGPGLIERREFDYPIPPGDAAQLLTLCRTSISKKRSVWLRCSNSQRNSGPRSAPPCVSIATKCATNASCALRQWRTPCRSRSRFQLAFAFFR